MNKIMAWDLDGTIVDTYDLMKDAYRRILSLEYRADLSLSNRASFSLDASHLSIPTSNTIFHSSSSILLQFKMEGAPLYLSSKVDYGDDFILHTVW